MVRLLIGKTIRLLINLVFIGGIIGGTLIGCGGSNTQSSTQSSQNVQKGIGPIKEVKLSQEVDLNLAKKGEELFNIKCSACHKLEERYVGPSLKGITKRRTPEWIMNMILNPEEMTKKDPIAQKLLEEYLTQMVAQVKDTSEARAILEYFRLIDSR